MENGSCGLACILQFASQKWNLQILFSMGKGCQTFGSIKTYIGEINQKILSSRLKELENLGFISKKTFEGKPLKSMYCLTEKGESFGKEIENLKKWEKRWNKIENIEN